MKKSKNSRKLNNKGLSLIEVLVAIMILAVVTGPLLHSFVTGIKLNAKAREKQRLTTAAQSIMEGLKAYDMEHICLQFNGWGMRLIANATNYYEEPISDRNGDGAFDVSIDPLDGTFLPASDGIYAFVLEGVDFDGITYDARIDISPNTVWNPSPSGSGSADLVDVVDMNEYLDAVYKQPANMDQSMYAVIVQNLLDELKDKDESDYVFELHDLENMVKDDGANLQVDKVITVTVSEGGDSSISIVTVETKYIYEATGFKYTDAAGNEQELVFSGEEFAADSGTVVYDNTNTAANGALLENIYLYYYPAYPRHSVYSSSSDPKTISSEKIILQNNTAEKNFYLIKQIDNNISNSNLSVYENKYSVSVTGSGAIILHHNLKDNLASPGSPVYAPSISGVTEAASGSVLEETPEILLYNVKISLYEAGAAGAGFPPEALLLELNGSMND